MWDILLHSSPRTSSAPLGEGLFDPSFFQTSEEASEEKQTVETEIFHHSTRAVDTSDGGQALPPYSSAADRKSHSEGGEQKLNSSWERSRFGPSDGLVDQYPSLSETMMWPGPGLRGDSSLMDLAHDPFFQFQDHQSPYMGIWEIGNL